jgi:hypothetical protein
MIKVTVKTMNKEVHLFENPGMGESETMMTFCTHVNGIVTDKTFPKCNIECVTTITIPDEKDGN